MSETILIIGGGVAGLQAAVDCAHAGARGILVERDAVIGGRLAAALTGKSSARELLAGAVIPELPAFAGHDSIEIITLAQLDEFEGDPGDFSVTIRERARFVTDTCTRCNRCHQVCPAVVPNEHDAGLSYRKAIYTPFPETFPGEYVIDIESCLNKPPNYLPCQRCIEVCEDDSIHFDLPLDRVHQRRVAAMIIAVGLEVEDSASLTEQGYGSHPDVVTSWELQRLLVAPGPTGGFVAKPSNEEYPASILLVQNELSPFAALVTASQMSRLAEQSIEQISLLVLGQRSDDVEVGVLETAAAEAGATVNWGTLRSVRPSGDNTLTVKYADLSSGRVSEEEYDLVVLGSQVRPPDGMAELARTAGIDLAENGYIAVAAEPGAGIATSRHGIYVAGCASGPKSVEDSIAEAHAAAAAALGECDAKRLRPRQTLDPVEGTVPRAWQELTESERRSRIERILHRLIELGEG